MKKLPSTLPNMLCVLTLISVIAAGALAYVNGVTAGPIEENKARVLAEGINSVLGVSDAKVESTTEAEDANGNPVILYATDKGVAVQAIDPNGFGGKLKVLVGFDEVGAIKGYTVLEHAETPGLGAKAGFWSIFEDSIMLESSDDLVRRLQSAVDGEATPRAEYRFR